MASSALAAEGAEESESTSSAFGIKATGPITIEPTPAVTSSDEKTQRSVATASAPADLVTARALNAKATQSDSSRSSVADLQVQAAQLTASAVSAACSDGAGTASIANADLAGTPLDASPPANTEVSVPGVATLVLNKQTENADGSLTVTAVHLAVEGAQTLDIASATCAQSSAQTPAPTPPGGGGETPRPPEHGAPPADAPRPTPVPGHLPVTH